MSRSCGYFFRDGNSPTIDFLFFNSYYSHAPYSNEYERMLHSSLLFSALQNSRISLLSLFFSPLFRPSPKLLFLPPPISHIPFVWGAKGGEKWRRGKNGSGRKNGGYGEKGGGGGLVRPHPTPPIFTERGKMLLRTVETIAEVQQIKLAARKLSS